MHSVQLIHSTQNGEELIAHMARVSNPSNQNNPSYSKLIRYLITHKHWSPFEMVNLCVKIKTTRSVAAQILRHRSFSFQEFSQRYAEVTEFPQIPDLRRQDLKNRQNSIDDVPSDKKQHFQDRIHDIFTQSLSLYNEMIEEGLAKECVRDILPLSTPTTLYMNGTLRSWLHYCDLRTANGTQQEHKYIAEGCKSIIQQQFPQVYTAMWSL